MTLPSNCYLCEEPVDRSAKRYKVMSTREFGYSHISTGIVFHEDCWEEQVEPRLKKLIVAIRERNKS